MAGYVLKIMIENTHPPVWRRVIIPEKITFYDLHLVIQILFGWENCHLHEFSIPSKHIYIGDPNKAGNFYNWNYPEEETLVEQFLLDNNWIRYTYDFGDDWRHKIILEKTDKDYRERYAFLLKAKGNNFAEDSGGVLGYDEEDAGSTSFDGQLAAEYLKKLVFPAHEDLCVQAELAWEDAKNIAEDYLKKIAASVRSSFRGYSLEDKPSRMALKIDKWKQFLQDSFRSPTDREPEKGGYSQMVLPFVSEEDLVEPGHVLEIVSGSVNCANLLHDLSLKEVSDYCKYLQIPYTDTLSIQQMADAVAQEFHSHSEYLLYVLDEEELREYLRLASRPNGRLEELPESDMLIKAFALGLADVLFEKKKGKDRAKLMFAADIPSLLTSIPDNLRKQTYRELKDFSDKLKNLILVYGVVDFESLRGMFRNVYHSAFDQKTFCRYIYWHARFNNMIQTAYCLIPGKQYAAAVELDLDFIAEKMDEYSEGRDYVSFSAKELWKMADNIAGKSDWVDILHAILQYEAELSESAASDILVTIFPKIMDGRPLSYIFGQILQMLPKEPDLAVFCDLWNAVSGLMLDLGLPMLKGRSREQYAKEENISPWDIDMVEETSAANTRERHMYEFGRDIQDSMFHVVNYRNNRNLNALWDYMKGENVQSEEFLYLLAMAYISDFQYRKADVLIRRLQRSSARGRKGAGELKQMMENEIDEMNEPEEDYDLFREYWEIPVSRPYVRETPKIGRNDPCPCGSGKKYKKCCGRNIV